MNAKAETAPALDVKRVKALTLVGSLAGKKYDTRITNSFASGYNNIMENLEKTKNNASKLVGKTVDVTAKFFANVKNRITR